MNKTVCEAFNLKLSILSKWWSDFTVGIGEYSANIHLTKGFNFQFPRLTHIRFQYFLTSTWPIDKKSWHPSPKLSYFEALHTVSFTKPPIPSTSPFKCDVAKKFHSILGILCSSANKPILDSAHLFLICAAHQSENISSVVGPFLNLDYSK